MRLRDFIDLLRFTVSAPVLGAFEASREVGGRFVRLAEEHRLRGTVRGGIEAELFRLASQYEQGGFGGEAMFEVLSLRLFQWLDDRRRMVSEALLAVVTAIVTLNLASLIPLLLGGVSPMLYLVTIAPLPFLLLVHWFQVELVKYNYPRPILTGLLGLAIAYFITWNPYWAVFGFCMGFATTYLPQFTRFIRHYLGMFARIERSFNELMWSPSPTEPLPLTYAEEEFRRLWLIARDLGVPLLVARINRLVAFTLGFIRNINSQFLIYSPFALLGFFISWYSLVSLNQAIPPVTPTGPLAGLTLLSIPTLAQAKPFMSFLALVTSLTFGKMAHSIGLGVSLAPALMIFVLGWP